MASRATIHPPGEPPREVSLPPGATAEVLPSVRVSGAEAPGLVLEGSPRRIRVGHRALRRGERWLLRPGESATVDGHRIVAGWDDPGTAAEARSVLLSALRGGGPTEGIDLVAIAGPLAGRRLRARPGVLGRGPDADTRIDDPSVSRAHSRLRLEGGRVLLEDLGSKNGSWIGGRRFDGLRALSPGESFRAGRTLLALAIEPPSPAATEAAPPIASPPPSPGRRVRSALLVAAAAVAAAALLVLQG
jgi:hypothetical protein